MTHVAITSLLFVLCKFAAMELQTNRVGGRCEGCELMFAGMPKVLSWETTIAGPTERGEPLIVTGTIYKRDGRTPAPNVVLYIYHTDASGLYSPAPHQTQGRAHGHLRGWMRTNERGAYKFTTIRPASYPNSRNPQHIHPIIKEPGKNEYWIDDYLFEDDPLLSSTDQKSQPPRGGSGILSVVRDSNGVWHGTRNIVLGLNVPNYE
jgi:protocatechuate 3,4-dioxygenase beta subunit